MRKKIRKSAIIVSIIVILILALIIYLTFFYAHKCKTEDCFFTRYAKCQRIRFNQDGWRYYVIGTRKENSCLTKVTAINPTGVDLETANELRGLNMKCYVPKDLTVDALPQEHLEYCHGELKEAIQEAMIKKMHLYIIKNLGNPQDFEI